MSKITDNNEHKIKCASPEYLDCISDLIINEKVLSMAGYIQHGGCTTLDHCICVSYFSYLNALKLRLNYKACARGGLLHDMYLYDWHTCSLPRGKLHGYVHPLIAAETAGEVFELSELEKEIILVHMWPLTLRPPRSREALIVSMTDKRCAINEIFRRNEKERLALVQSVLDFAGKHKQIKKQCV